MSPGRGRARRAGGAVAVAVLALAITWCLGGAAAAACPGAYAAQLRNVATQIDAGLPAAGAARDLRVIAAGAGASAALTPLIAELEGGDTAGVAAQLRSYAAAVRPASGSGCGTALGAAARRDLAGVYREPALSGLDQPRSPSWAQQLLDAVAGALSRALRAIGPVPAGVVAALVLGGVGAFVVWRLRQVAAERSGARASAPAVAVRTDPDAEWACALAAADARDFREAVRRAYRSALLSLATRRRLAVRSEWTTTELLAHARGDPELLAPLAPASAVFDLAWYSPLPVGEAEWQAARAQCQAIRALPRPPAGVA